MSLRRTYGLFFFFALLFAQKLPAQGDPVIAAFQEEFFHTTSRQKFSELFLHVDKTVYAQNEYIWFNACLLHMAAPLQQYHTLYANLYNKDSVKALLSGQFVIKNGVANGSFLVSDSMPPGNYIFAVHTNILSGKPENDFFYQQVKVTPQYKDPYKISFNANQTTRVQADSVFFAGYVNRLDGEPVSKLHIDYRLQSGRELLAQGHIKLKETGLFSQAIGNDFSKYGQLTLSGRIRSDDYFVPFEKELKSDTATVKAQLYAEGGRLIEGIESAISVETATVAGKPVSMPLHIFSNGLLVKEITTDKAGWGQFFLTPHPGSVYTVQPGNDRVLYEQPRFPAVHPAGSLISLEKNVITSDTILVDLLSTVKNVTAYLVLHDYADIYYFSKFTISKNSQLLAIPAAVIPRGIYALTLLDKDGRPVAERCLFLHYAKQPQMDIVTDSAVYHPRSKITVHISTTGSNRQPLPAFFSAALVQRPHIDSLKMMGIFSAFYLDPFYKRMTGRPMGFLVADNRQALERALATKFNTVYTPYKATITPKDTFLQQLGYSGYVLYRNRQPEKPLELILMKNNQVSTVQTNEKGLFEIAPEELETNPGEKIMAFVNQKNKDDYTIVLNNEREGLEANRDIYFFEKQPAIPAGSVDVVPYTGEPDPLYKILPPVTVKATRTSGEADRPVGMPVFKSKTCNDYICLNNILNCPNHPFGGAKPQSGETYRMSGRGGMYSSSELTFVVYEGCDKTKNVNDNRDQFLYRLRSRSYAYDFIPVNYSVNDAPLPELNSTVYWNPFLQTGEDGKATFSFYTNDLTGTFVLHVEAVSTGDVFSKKILVRVIK